HGLRDGIGFSIRPIWELAKDSDQRDRIGLDQRDPALLDLLGIVLRTEPVADGAGDDSGIVSLCNEFLDLSPGDLSFHLGWKGRLRGRFLLDPLQAQRLADRSTERLRLLLANAIISQNSFDQSALALR